MITYHWDSENLRDLIADLGRVPGIHTILEEAESLYESLFEEYRQRNDSLRELSSRIIVIYKVAGRDLDGITMRCAAGRGDLEVLRSFGDRSPADEWVIESAVEGGQLEVVRELRDGSFGERCPWNSFATDAAAMRGHVEILRALRDGSLDGKCPWDKNYCRRFAHSQAIVDLIDSGELD